MTGALVVWTGITRRSEASFNGWYNRQHLSERVNVPGFINGRRYRAIHGHPDYLAVYEVDAPDVFAGTAYTARQNDPTGWTSSVMRDFRDFTRMTGEVRAKVGQGLGGACASWRLTPVPGRESDLVAWLGGEVLPGLMADAAVIGGMLVSPSEGLADAGRQSTESRMRETSDNPPCWALLIETADVAKAEAFQAELDPTTLAEHGVERSEPGIYALITAVGRFDSTPAPDPAS
jgi:hypothetical protein